MENMPNFNLLVSCWHSPEASRGVSEPLIDDEYRGVVGKGGGKTLPGAALSLKKAVPSEGKQTWGELENRSRDGEAQWRSADCEVSALGKRQTSGKGQEKYHLESE